MMPHTLLAIVIAAVSPALAQPQSQPAPALGGPKLASPAPAATLVERDFDGALKRLDVPAEEAALALLKLTPEEQEATRQVLAERATILDGVIADNIPLLLRLQGAKEGKNKTEQFEVFKELTDKLKDLRDRGSLREELAAHLTRENAAELERISKEYWRALVEEAMQTSKASGENLQPREVVGREILKAVGQEVKRSYDRQIAAKTGQLDELLSKVGATPEQDLKIRNLSTDYFQKTLGKPTPEQRREFFMSIMKELNADQRKTLLEELYGK